MRTVTLPAKRRLVLNCAVRLSKAINTFWLSNLSQGHHDIYQTLRNRATQIIPELFITELLEAYLRHVILTEHTHAEHIYVEHTHAEHTYVD